MKVTRLSSVKLDIEINSVTVRLERLLEIEVLAASIISYDSKLFAQSTNLHKAGDGLYAMIGLVEGVPPGVRGTGPSRVLCRLGQKERYIRHAPLGPTELGIQESGTGVVLQHGLQMKNHLYCHKREKST